MSLIVRLYCDERIYSIDMSKIDYATIGSDSSDTIRLLNCGLKKAQVTIEKVHGSYIIKGKRLYDSENSPISSDTLVIGNKYVVDSEPEINIAIHPKQEDSNKAVGLRAIEEIFIGRSRNNDIILNNRRTSSSHCKIYRESGLLKIRDLRSSNGTYVNGKKIYEKTLIDGDRINISIYEIVFNNNALTFYNVGDDLQLNIEKEESVEMQEGRKPSKGTMSVFDVNINIEKDNGQYDIQIKQKIKTGTMSVFDIDEN